MEKAIVSIAVGVLALVGLYRNAERPILYIITTLGAMAALWFIYSALVCAFG